MQEKIDLSRSERVKMTDGVITSTLALASGILAVSVASDILDESNKTSIAISGGLGLTAIVLSTYVIHTKSRNPDKPSPIKPNTRDYPEEMNTSETLTDPNHSSQQEQEQEMTAEQFIKFLRRQKWIDYATMLIILSLPVTIKAVKKFFR